MMPDINRSSCAICGCADSKQQQPRITRAFYRFPKVRDVAKKWISVCDFKNIEHCSNEDYFYKNHYVICSDHFESIWFKNRTLLSKGLLEGAIPTMNLNIKRNGIESFKNPIEVKLKVEHYICHGCFTADRRTSPLGDLAHTLASLLSPPVNKKSDITQLCWECMALLRKVQKFQRQLEYAQSVWTGYEEKLSLSTLNVTIKDYFDQEIQYNEDFEENNIFNSNTPITPNHADLPPVKIEENDITNFPSIEDINDFSTQENGITNFPTRENGMSDFQTPDNCVTDFVDLETDITESPMVKIETTDSPMVKTETTDSATALEDWSDELIDTDLNECEEVDANNTLKKKKDKRMTRRMKYKEYANIIRHSKTDWKKPYYQYYTEIQFDEADIETHFLTKERKRTPAKMILKCDECALSYSRKMDLDRHNNLNHHKPGTPYKCLHCNEIQPCMDSLKAHWRSHSVFYQCTLCCNPFFVWRFSLALHLSRTHATVYSCTSCKLQYSSLQAFSEHYHKNHPFICDYCNKRCALRKSLENHIKGNHMPKKCPICDVTFPSTPLYRRHVLSRHPKVTTKPELSYCVECNKQYRSRELYLSHVKNTHALKNRDMKSVPCPECGKCFKKNSYMENHYNFYHLKVTKFRCDLCDKYFLKGYGLRTHMKNIHLKIPKPKTKVCDFCGRAFHTITLLANHRRTHTGERPFKCAYCPAAFAQKGAMKLHQQKQHNHTDRTEHPPH